jgi:tRNA A37 methylthiotransferase MiaB
MMSNKNTFHLVSLGCAKNTVDSDSMAQLLIRMDINPLKAQMTPRC